jgi:hypothetical protein
MTGRDTVITVSFRTNLYCPPGGVTIRVHHKSAAPASINTGLESRQAVDSGEMSQPHPPTGGIWASGLENTSGVRLFHLPVITILKEYHSV